MKIKELLESGSGVTSSDISTFIKGGTGPKVGTLFGGSYKQERPKKSGSKKTRESIIRR
jgi:hypothetical protein